MNIRTLINVVLVAGLAYAGFCGYQYWQLREVILEELKSKSGINKVIPDLSSMKIKMSQYPAVGCENTTQPTWWEMVLKHRSQGCYRLSLNLQSETMKTVKLSADYDTDKLIGERFSYVMICKKLGEVTLKDNGLPRRYENCE